MTRMSADVAAGEVTADSCNELLLQLLVKSMIRVVHSATVRFSRSGNSVLLDNSLNRRREIGRLHP